MWFKTLRGKLTLWNLGVLSFTLLLFGLVLNVTNQKRLAEEIDHDLLNRAKQMSQGPPGLPPGTEPGRPPGSPGPPPRRLPPPERISELLANDPLAFIHRPEMFSADGRLVGPNSSGPPFDPALVAVALKGMPAFSTTEIGGVRVRVVAVPLLHGGQIAGVVETAREMTDYEQLWRGQTLTLLVLLPLAVLVAGGGALFLTNRALRPIAAVTAAADQISEQDLSRRLTVAGDDELAHLAATFNRMVERLQASFETLRSAYENQRRFTADASHELRTPLTRLKLATGSALLEPDVPSAVLDSLRIADRSADAMSKIVEQLLLLSRADAGQLALRLKPVDLRVVAAEAVDSMGVDRPIELILPDQPVMVMADEDHLRRVVVNLLQNSIRHTLPERGVHLSVGQDNQMASIQVRDEGEGIAPEHLGRLGERFYRVDPARTRAEGGFGLGLSICKSIAEAHGGSLAIASKVGQGTTATLQLPGKVSAEA